MLPLPIPPGRLGGALRASPAVLETEEKEPKPYETVYAIDCFSSIFKYSRQTNCNEHPNQPNLSSFSITFYSVTSGSASTKTLSTLTRSMLVTPRAGHVGSSSSISQSRLLARRCERPPRRCRPPRRLRDPREISPELRTHLLGGTALMLGSGSSVLGKACDLRVGGWSGASAAFGHPPRLSPCRF